MPSVDWPNKIINVPLSDLSLVSAGVYQHDVDAFRLALKDLEDGEGMPFADTHAHSTAVTVGGVTLARVVEIINGYSVTYEDGLYRVVLVGANNNILDVANVNQVSIAPTNSAGLIQVNTGGSGLTTAQASQLATAATNTTTLLTRLTEARVAALDLLQDISDRVLNMLKGLGRFPGVSVTQLDPSSNAGDTGSLTTSDGSIDQTITRNADGGVTVENNS